MEYRYRVTGWVERAFILRGFYFPIGKEFAMDISEAEMPFVKDRCNSVKVIDLEKTAENPMPVKQKSTQRRGSNERRTSKSKHQGTV